MLKLPKTNKIVATLKNLPQITIDIAASLLKTIMWQVSGYMFDKTYNINTNKRIEHAYLDANEKCNLKYATAYQAIPVKYLHRLFYLLRNDSADTHFVDIGCGKGRACFYACQKYKKVTGIDFSPTLIKEAKRNLVTFSGLCKGELKFELQDASLYDLPNEPSLVYLYNPFDEYIFRKFLERNLAHFIKYKSKIAYVNSVCSALLLEYGFKQDIYCESNRISIYLLDIKK